MKKIIVLVFATIIFSCNSNNKKANENTKTNNEVGVQNENGGIPDTTNAINLSTHKKDTLQKRDSIK